MSLDKTQLLSLYDTIVEEEHFFLEAHQTRINFYFGIVSLFLAAMGAGLLQGSKWYHFTGISVGSIAIFIVSHIAIVATRRIYQRFLEVITIRAKIEQELDLTKRSRENSVSAGEYWAGESFVPDRQLTSRTDSESSSAFIKRAFEDGGTHKPTVELFRVFQWLSVALFVATLSLSIQVLRSDPLIFGAKRQVARLLLASIVLGLLSTLLYYWKLRRKRQRSN